ncbi:MAG: hypothetical protein CENE_00465 [Candidatus Celerinatantimonas neptuna]|nr:MAG: hypothetical protein CENE_00465 [Candidatus Celerinatantimonas neptuna]
MGLILSNDEFCLLEGPVNAPLLVLAHGAGAGFSHEFFQALVPMLTDEIAVLRFNFSYMQKMLRLGKRHPPDRLPKLIDAFHEVIPQWPQRVFIGGKSMGGRVATHVALQRNDISGVIVFGFPFHASGKTLENRASHFTDLVHPTLIFQGERDPFGNYAEIKAYHLSSYVRLCWLKDADHSFIPRKRSGLTQLDHLSSIARQVKEFILCRIHHFGVS